jgi:hypothetical protein
VLEKTEQRPIEPVEEEPEALLAAGALLQLPENGFDRLAPRAPRFHRQSPKSWKAAQKNGAEASVSSACPEAVVIWTGCARPITSA